MKSFISGQLYLLSKRAGSIAILYALYWPAFKLYVLTQGLMYGDIVSKSMVSSKFTQVLFLVTTGLLVALLPLVVFVQFRTKKRDFRQLLLIACSLAIGIVIYITL